MNNLFYFLSIYMFIISCFLFSYFYKHLMLIIISLEFITISVFYNMFLNLMIWGNDFMMVILFLTMSVCEGALALSLIVLIVRYYGNDYMNSLMMLKW